MAVFTSKATGNWDAEGQTTWNEAGHPQAGDTVTVQNTHTVTLDSATSCTTLVIDSGGTLTDATNNVGLTVSGYSEITGTMTCGTANMSFASGQTGDMGADFLIGSVFNGGSGNHTFGSITFKGVANLTSGVTTINAYWDWAGGFYALIFNDDTFDDSNGTIQFTHATGDQRIWCCANIPHTFYNLIINKGGGIVQYGSACGFTLTVANNFTITSGTFNTETTNNVEHDLVVNNISITGTLICNGSAIDINGTLTIGADGVLTSTTGNLNYSGTTWTNNGTFTHSDGTVIFDGTNQEIDGSNTFYNFTKAVTSAATLTIDNTSTQTFVHNVTLNGASEELLSILSDSIGVAFNFTMTATAVKTNLDFLSVKDSDASGSHANHKPIDPTSSSDISGNTDWFSERNYGNKNTMTNYY